MYFINSCFTHQIKVKVIHLLGWHKYFIIWQGQNQSGGGGTGGDKRDDKDKKKKYEPPIPTRVGKKRRRTKGPDAAMKLPQGKIVINFDI